MTGYGKAVAQLENGKITVEIRTLNGTSTSSPRSCPKTRR